MLSSINATTPPPPKKKKKGKKKEGAGSIACRSLINSEDYCSFVMCN